MYSGIGIQGVYCEYELTVRKILNVLVPDFSKE